MYAAFLIYAPIEMKILGADVYNNPNLFYDMKETMLQFTIGFAVLKIFHAFLLSYLHEKLPRCGSPLWEKVWRFSLLAFLLVHGVGLGMTVLTMPIEKIMIASWLINGLVQTFACSFAIIPILYKFPAPDTSCKFVPKK